MSSITLSNAVDLAPNLLTLYNPHLDFKISKKLRVRDSRLRDEYFLLGKKGFCCIVAQFHSQQQFPGEKFPKLCDEYREPISRA